MQIGSASKLYINRDPDPGGINFLNPDPNPLISNDYSPEVWNSDMAMKNAIVNYENFYDYNETLSITSNSGHFTTTFCKKRGRGYSYMIIYMTAPKHLSHRLGVIYH